MPLGDYELRTSDPLKYALFWMPDTNPSCCRK